MFGRSALEFVRVFKKKRATTPRYKITRGADGWIITYRGETFGPYRSRLEAVTMAVIAARKLGEQGKKAKIRLIDAGGKVVDLTAYGAESYLAA